MSCPKIFISRLLFHRNTPQRVIARFATRLLDTRGATRSSDEVANLKLMSCLGNSFPFNVWAGFEISPHGPVCGVGQSKPLKMYTIGFEERLPKFMGTRLVLILKPGLTLWSRLLKLLSRWGNSDQLLGRGKQENT